MSINMSQLASKMAEAANKVEPVCEKKLATLAQVAVGYVKEEIQAVHAVDTGSMLNSTHSTKEGKLTYVIGPSVHYAIYVALGTSRIGARPFHLSAARRLEKDTKDFLGATDLGV